MPDPRFPRFSAVTPAWTNREMHLHTNRTDGKPTVPEVIARAEALGLAEIAFTEHVRRDSAWFPEFADEVRRAAAGSPVRVLVGAEARIVDESGELDLSDAIRAECDLVLGSVHRFPDGRGGLVAFRDVPRETFAGIEHGLARAFLRHGRGDVLAHPGGMSVRQIGGFPDELALDLMREARASGKAYEIDVAYIDDLDHVVALLRREDPSVSLGSDAHELDRIGEARERLSRSLFAAEGRVPWSA